MHVGWGREGRGPRWGGVSGVDHLKGQSGVAPVVLNLLPLMGDLLIKPTHNNISPLAPPLFDFAGRETVIPGGRLYLSLSKMELCESPRSRLEVAW